MRLLWVDFLNSFYHDWRGGGRTTDRLEQPEWLEKFLSQWHLTYAGPVDQYVLNELKGLRQALATHVQKIVKGIPLNETDLQELNKLLESGQLKRQLSAESNGYQLALIPVGQDVVQLKAEITGSFAQTLANGEHKRIKLCDNKDCRWVFYDDTKNRSKRYCDDKTCGNLMKVRRHRARKKSDVNKPLD